MHTQPTVRRLRVVVLLTILAGASFMHARPELARGQAVEKGVGAEVESAIAQICDGIKSPVCNQALTGDLGLGDACVGGFVAECREASPITTRFDLVPTPLRDVVSGLIAADLRPSALYHGGATTGGYLLAPTENMTIAMSDYYELHREETGYSEIMIDGVEFKSSLVAEVLGDALGGKVLDQRTTVRVRTPDTFSAITDPTQAPSGGEIDAKATKKFAPLTGRVLGTNHPGTRRPSRIENTMQWAQGDLADFNVTLGLDYAYEHDLKLLAACDVDCEKGKQPFCTQEHKHFWAYRKARGTYWYSSFPSSARPFFDTNWGDDCVEMDQTIGLELPKNVSEGVRYKTVIRTNQSRETNLAGDPEPNPILLVAQRATRVCDGDPKLCLLNMSETLGARSQRLVGDTHGELHGCRIWRKGWDSTAC